MGYDPYFIQTEFEVIQSELILGKVITDLDLNKEWGRKYGNGDPLKTTETIALLKGRMDLRPVRNTSLIEILVYSEKPEEAARIANAVADAYQAYRLEERKKLTMGGINALKENVAEQELKVKKAQEELDQLRKDLKVPDTFINGEGPTMLMSAETLRRIEGLRIESMFQYSKEDTLLNTLKELSPDELVQTIPRAAPDPLLSSLLEQLTMVEQKLLTIKKDYGPEHAETIKATSQVEDLRNKIQESVKGIMTALEKRVVSAKSALDKLEAEVEKAKGTDIAQAE